VWVCRPWREVEYYIQLRVMKHKMEARRKSAGETRRNEAGGSLRASTRPTLNRRNESARLHEGKSCSNLGRALVLNDPHARRR
jgi:hypothetical protein